MIHHDGTYYLFFAANSYASANSGVGFATSDSLLEPYSNRSVSGPWLGSTVNATGPQGPMFFADFSGVTRLAVAAWYGPVGYRNGGMRALWIADFRFEGQGSPVAS